MSSKIHKDSSVTAEKDGGWPNKGTIHKGVFIYSKKSTQEKGNKPMATSSIIQLSTC